MKAISLFLLCSLLFNQISSQDNAMIHDMTKCGEKNMYGATVTTDTCTSVSSVFESPDSECCKLETVSDEIQNLKATYGENWKSVICQMIGISESTSEEEIRNTYYPPETRTTCQYFMKSSKIPTLFGLAYTTLNNQVTYNCGNGDEIFDAKKYYPTNSVEALAKDSFSCNTQYSQKDCIKSGNKLINGEWQCCWCQTTYLNQAMSSANSNECMSYMKSTFEQNLKFLLETYRTQGQNMEYSCTCSDPNGANMQGKFDTSTGEISVN